MASSSCNNRYYLCSVPENEKVYSITAFGDFNLVDIVPSFRVVEIILVNDSVDVVTRVESEDLQCPNFIVINRCKR